MPHSRTTRVSVTAISKPFVTDKTLHYIPDLFRRWVKAKGTVQRAWFRRWKGLFSERDLANALNQPHYGFGEWRTAIHFRRKGWSVLTSKYTHPARIEKRWCARQVLGADGFRFLMRRRKLGSKRLRRSPKPDLLVFKPGTRRFFFVEVKRAGDRLSRAQALFFPMIRRKLRRKVLVVKLKPRKRKSSSIRRVPRR